MESKHVWREGGGVGAPRGLCELQQGSAIIWALLFVVITSGLVVSHTAFMASRRGDRDARYNRAGMADTFARSGLQDAVGWFLGRSNQPITTFDPANDPSGTPPRVETLDPTLGLVREFEINGSLWGRYEVRREEALDISTQRGDLVPGSVWALGVRAFVFRKRDAARKFNEEPNQLIGTKKLDGEIRWLQISPPATAALCADDPSKVVIGGGAKIEGGSMIGIAFRDAASITPSPSSSSPSIATGASVTGAPSVLATPTYDASPERVFAMRSDELRTYSDLSLDSPVGTGGMDWAAFLAWLRSALSGGGSPMPTMPMSPTPTSPTTTPPTTTPTIEGKLLVASGLRLGGKLVVKNSVLFVDGDLTSDTGADTKIEGVVYVSGNAVLDKGNFELTGALIVRGQVKLGTGLLNSVTLRYDAAKIEQLRRSVGKYRTQRGRNL